MSKLTNSLKLTGSTVTLFAAMSAGCGLAYAQNANSSADAGETVVVTGTSIRGIAPIGSNLITVGSEAIEKTAATTMGQVMATIPALTSFGNMAQGQLAGSSYYAPNIHQLGSSASTSTLVVIDGHRIPFGAPGHDQADPNIVPTNAVQRVEVLADGASSIYGSDAVAGVVNFITRTHYDGLQLTAQSGFATGYRTNSAGLLWGTGWPGGDVMVAYTYSGRGSISNASRPSYTDPDKTAQAAAAGLPPGATNFKNFNCSPATVQPGGSGSTYYYGSGYTQTVNSAQANALCFSTHGRIAQPEYRNNMMVKVGQEFFGGKLKATTEVLVSNRYSDSSTGPGTVTATVFGAGPQANPFFVTPPGTTATKQTIRFNFDDLLPDSGQSLAAADVYWFNTHLEWKVDDNYRVTLGVLYGKDLTYSRAAGALCSSCVNLALNGTTNTTGSTTAASIAGTNAILTQLPLTTANALDVWNGPSGNRTSADTLAALKKATTSALADRGMKQVRLGVDGDMFDLPAGPVRMAVGAEFIAYQNVQESTGSLNIGPSTRGSTAEQYRFSRHVWSAYGELAIPVISEAADIPLVRKIDVDISGRYDDYSDVGITANPKVAVNWMVLDGLELRANASTSFVAPALDSRGDPAQFYNASFSGVSVLSGAFNINALYYPEAYQVPGATITGTANTPCVAPAPVCTVGSSTVQGLRYIRGGGLSLKPQQGRGWTAGVHFTPTFLPGLTVDVTKFVNTFMGGVTSPNLQAAANTPKSLGLLYVFPTGATPAQIAALTANIPNTVSLPVNGVYYIDNFNQQNVLNLWVRGYDISLDYRFDTDNLGSFSISDSTTVFSQFREQYGDGGAVFSVLNTNGFNQTFPSIQLQSSGHFNWDYDAFGFQFTANYTAGYHNWGSNSLTPLKVDSFGTPTGGGDPVKANLTYDVHLSYSFQNDVLGDSQIALDGQNIFNSRPPFYNGASGYDTYVGNPIGRVVSLALRVKL